MCPCSHSAYQGKLLHTWETKTEERDFKILQVSELLFPFRHPSCLSASFKCNAICFILIMTERLHGSKDDTCTLHLKCGLGNTTGILKVCPYISPEQWISIICKNYSKSIKIDQASWFSKTVLLSTCAGGNLSILYTLLFSHGFSNWGEWSRF